MTFWQWFNMRPTTSALMVVLATYGTVLIILMAFEAYHAICYLRKKKDQPKMRVKMVRVEGHTVWHRDSGQPFPDLVSVEIIREEVPK